jgi:hypothetical protein
MARAETTLHGWDSRFWMKVPLPVAEVGARLHAGRDDYFEQLLKLAEDAVTMAGALALARARSRWSPELAAQAAGWLVRPAFGPRAALLWALEAGLPGVTGWDPEEDASALGELIRLVNPGSMPRRPRLRHVFEALAKLRNDEVHRRLAQSQRSDAAALLELAVFHLVQRNDRFEELLLHADRVQRTPDGGQEVMARALNGQAIATYRRGDFARTTPDLLPAQVFFAPLERPVPVHPFVVLRNERVYVLDEIRASGPVLRHFASREPLEEDLRESWDQAWPQWRTPFAQPRSPHLDAAAASPAVADTAAWSGGPQPPSEAGPVGAPHALHAPSLRGPGPEAPPSVEARPVATPQAVAAPPRRGRRGVLPVVTAIGCGGLLLAVAVLGGIGAWTWSGGDEDAAPPPARAAVGAEPVSACPRAAAATAAIPEALPQIVTGAPIRWGSDRGEAERACGKTERFPFPECARQVAAMREATWSPGLDVPQVRHLTLAHHHERGFFEAMIYSDADADALARVVQQRLGRPPHRWVRSLHRIWEYRLHDGSQVRLKVSPLTENHRLGRSAIKLHHARISELYRSERRRVCGDRGSGR